MSRLATREAREQFKERLEMPAPGDVVRSARRGPSEAELEKDAESFMDFMSTATVGP